MRREQFVNNAQTTLASGITDTATSATVVTGSVFPADGDFRIRIGEELILVTARSTNTLTIERGIENTSGAVHSAGEEVIAVLTKSSLEEYQKENTWSGNTSFPLRLFDLSDGSPATVSTFTWVNQGSATATDRDGRIVLLTPNGSGQDVHALVQSSPSAPYSIVCAFSLVGQREASMQFGLTFRESSTSKLFAITRDCTDNIRIEKHTNSTSLSSSVSSAAWQFGNSVTWFKIEDNNTNLIFYVSPNGQDWIQIASEARTTFMTGGPNQVGFYGNPYTANSNDMLAEVYAFGEV